MNRAEFNLLLEKQIYSQGTASIASLPELLKELARHVPYVVHLSDEATEQGGVPALKVIDPQTEIDEIIDEASSSEMAHIVVHNNGQTFHFNHISVDDGCVFCYLKTEGEFLTLKLSKESGSSELTITN